MSDSRHRLFVRSWWGWRQWATLCAAALCGAAQAQWTQDGGQAAKTFANTDETLLSRSNAQELAPRWQMMIGQFYASSATQADGRLFTCSNLYGATAQAPDSGEFLWSRSNTGGRRMMS